MEVVWTLSTILKVVNSLDDAVCVSLVLLGDTNNSSLAKFRNDFGKATSICTNQNCISVSHRTSGNNASLRLTSTNNLVLRVEKRQHTVTSSCHLLTEAEGASHWKRDVGLNLVKLVVCSTESVDSLTTITNIDLLNSLVADDASHNRVDVLSLVEEDDVSLLESSSRNQCTKVWASKRPKLHVVREGVLDKTVRVIDISPCHVSICNVLWCVVNRGCVEVVLSDCVVFTNRVLLDDAHNISSDILAVTLCRRNT